MNGLVNGAVKVKGRTGYCICESSKERVVCIYEPCVQSQGRGQACPIGQKCQGQ